ncbi:phosphotyrosine protein phosphatase I superfamily [Xylariaceae sp. FL0594]|nr:phosphotyrosine protein phosphatase I superfamily [Xylariaceae sp. FL0594]
MPNTANAGNGEKVNVLFVCLGNICRSTMAEGVFQSMVKDPSSPYHGLIGTVDSCGTGGYHIGDEPDSRTLATLRANGITNYRHEARKLCNSDFSDFDYIFAMDRSNLSDIQRWRRNKTDDRAKIMLFGEFSGTGRAEVVEDPYYIGGDSFKKTYEQCRRFSENFLSTTFPQVHAESK